MERRGEFGAVAASPGLGSPAAAARELPSRVPAAHAVAPSGGGCGLRWRLVLRGGVGPGRGARGPGALEPGGRERMVTVIKVNTARPTVGILFWERSSFKFLISHDRSEVTSLVFHVGKQARNLPEYIDQELAERGFEPRPLGFRTWAPDRYSRSRSS